MAEERDFFYRPEGAVAADFIPFYADGAFRLFYLLDWRDRERHGEGTPWYQVTTRDFVTFAEQGEMLARGTVDEQDLSVFTGCVVKTMEATETLETVEGTEAPGQYHIFYTGHNPHFVAQDRPQEAVMHAVSDDLRTWRKLPKDTFYAPEDRYEKHDWRDPFVFWNAEAGEWWMLLAARRKTGPPRRRGCTALCASKDLKTWEARPPFWEPGLYFTHECPDLFRMGDWWYLVFSEFSEGVLTRYRMSRSLAGPWLRPANDTFDGRAFYAAKTASDGERRFLFGWIATRADNKDYAGWQWGGNLVVHELIQQADGTLAVSVPDTVDRAFGVALPSAFQTGLGNWQATPDRVNLDATGTFVCASAGTMPNRCKIETTLTFAPDTQACGLLLRSSADFQAAYYVRVEPRQNRLVFDAYPRPGDQPFMMGLERPLRLEPGVPARLQVFVDSTICEVYANGSVALSARMYNLLQGEWGVFAQEGAAQFTDTQLWTT